LEADNDTIDKEDVNLGFHDIKGEAYAIKSFDYVDK